MSCAQAKHLHGHTREGPRTPLWQVADFPPKCRMKVVGEVPPNAEIDVLIRGMQAQILHNIIMTNNKISELCCRKGVSQLDPQEKSEDREDGAHNCKVCSLLWPSPTQ